MLLDERDWRALRRAAARKRTTVAEWVRTALRSALEEATAVDADAKRAAVRAAMRFEFPTADIGQMLAEVESGYVRAAER